MSDDTDAAARRLRRLRWGVRIVLALGLLASIAANVLHAEPNPVSQVIAAWSPLALLLTVELISRVPVHRPVLAVVRLTAAAVIALIAAYVSYFHLAAATPPAAGPTGEPSAADHPPSGATGHESPPSSDTARAVACWRQRDPELTAAAIARKIGKSERTVRRNWLSDQHAPTADLAAGG
jgi:hypothetical protein